MMNPFLGRPPAPFSSGMDRSHERTAARTRDARTMVLAACMMATFMAAVESSIVATAMPTIVATLGGFQLFSWVFSAYLLAQAVTIPIYGRLADLFGRKRVFFAGAAVFLIGSTLSGLAQSMPMLVAVRILQGFGAGAIVPIAYTILGDIYTPPERAHIQGLLSGVWGIAAVIGPPLGAFLVVQVDWRLVFWINLPIGLAAIIMIGTFLHERRVPRRHRIDLIGAALLMVGLGAGVAGAGQGQRFNLIALMLLAAASLTAFVVWEKRIAEPILPPRLWRDRVIVIGGMGGFTSSAVMMSITVFLPTYVQAAMGLSAMVAGVTLGAMSVSWALASAGAGRLMVRTTYRLAAIIGAIMLLAGCAVLIAMTPASGAVWAGTGAFVVGVGMGFCTTTFIVSVQAHVTWQERGVATSAQMCMRMVGQSIGAAVSGAVLAFGMRDTRPGMVDELLNRTMRLAMAPDERARLVTDVGGGLHNVYLFSGALALATLVLALGLPAALSPRHQGRR